MESPEHLVVVFLVEGNEPTHQLHDVIVDHARIARPALDRGEHDVFVALAGEVAGERLHCHEGRIRVAVLDFLEHDVVVALGDVGTIDDHITLYLVCFGEVVQRESFIYRRLVVADEEQIAKLEQWIRVAHYE